MKWKKWPIPPPPQMPKPLYRSSIQLEFKMTASKTWFIIEVFSSNIMPAHQASILAPIAMKERLHEISLPCTHSLTVPMLSLFVICCHFLPFQGDRWFRNIR